MTVTADQVEVVLRANTAQYNAALKQSDAVFTAVTANAVKSANRVTAASDQASSSFSGIGAQFQDIGVTAAMGMNPLLIALQQGTQLSSQLALSAKNGQSVFKSLGVALASVVSPLSLATIAAVAIGAALLQSMGEVIPKTETANEAIKRHREELEGVVEGYDAASDAISDYFDAAERLPQFVAADRIREGFAGIGEDVEKFRAQAESLGQVFVGFGSAAEQRLSQLAADFADGTISAEEFYVGLEDVERNLNAVERALSFMPGAIGGTINSMKEGALQAIAFANAINTVVAASHALAGAAGNEDLQNALDLRSYVDEQERLNGLTAEELSLEKQIDNIKRQAGEFGITDEKARELAEATLAAEERRAQIRKDAAAGAKAGSAAANDAEREAAAVVELIAALEYEQSILGMTVEQQAVANALREAGAAATDTQRARIEELITATMQEEEAIRRTEQAMKAFENMASQAVTGFISDLRNGKSAAEALSNVFDDLANQLIQIAVKNLVSAAFGGLFGGGGGGFLGGLFGGARANGGPVAPGRTYLVGERGPELFTPSGAGNITPNGGSSPMGGGEVVVYVQSSEYFDAHVETISGNVSARVSGSAINKYDSNLTDRMGENDARYR